MIASKVCSAMYFLGVIITLACAGCRTVSTTATMMVTKVNSTFVKKGPIDEYDVQSTDDYSSCLIEITDTAVIFHGECPLLTTGDRVDTVSYRNWTKLLVIDDDDDTRLYPGDELGELSYDGTAKLTIGRSFVELLEIGAPSHIIVSELLYKRGSSFNKQSNSIGLFLIANASRDKYRLYVDWRLQVLLLGRGQ